MMIAKLCFVAMMAFALAEEPMMKEMEEKIAGTVMMAADEQASITDEEMHQKEEMDMAFFEPKVEGEEMTETMADVTEMGAAMIVDEAAKALEEMPEFDELTGAEKQVTALAVADTMLNMMENVGIDSDEALDKAAEDLAKQAEAEMAKGPNDRQDFGLGSNLVRRAFISDLARRSRFGPFGIVQAFRPRIPFGSFGFAQSPLLFREEGDEATADENIDAGIFKADGTIDPEIEAVIDEAVEDVYQEMKYEEMKKEGAEMEGEMDAEMEASQDQAAMESMKDGLIDTMGAMMIDREAIEKFMEAEGEVEPEEKDEALEGLEGGEAEESNLDRQFGFGRRPFGFRRFGFPFVRRFGRGFFPGAFGFGRRFGGFGFGRRFF